MTISTQERLGRLERLVIALHVKINSLMRIQDFEIDMEFSQMADFTELVAKVEKIRGAAASTNAFVVGLKKQIEDLAAGMNDAEDQAKVMALAADVDAISDTLPQAIAADPSLGGT